MQALRLYLLYYLKISLWMHYIKETYEFLQSLIKWSISEKGL